jgi:mRNA interferase RelE/StbE
MPAFVITYAAAAVRDLDRLPPKQAAGLVKKIGRLSEGLQGDIKRLKDFDSMYRLRMGDYRVLFDVADGEVIIQRIKHRSVAYD